MSKDMYSQIIGDSGFKTADSWNEADHPRADNGQFGSGGGGMSKQEKQKAEKKAIATKFKADQKAAESKAIAIVNAGKKTDMPQYKNANPKSVGSFAKTVFAYPHSIDTSTRPWVLEARGMKVDEAALVESGLIEPSDDNYRSRLTRLGVEIAEMALAEQRNSKKAK